MIYFTGDLHGDRSRIKKSELNMLKTGDTLIVCGDFGFVWDGSKREKRFLSSLERRPYNICFVDGTHEGFKLLNEAPCVNWNGGMVHRLGKNIYHLMRGQIFLLEGKKIFVMGGGEDPEKDPVDFDDGEPRPEIPTSAEMLTGADNLEKLNFKVDYIVTHEPPAKTRDFLNLSSGKTLRITSLGAYLDELSAQVEYKRWFFGSMHTDKFVSSAQTALFRDIVCDK